MHSTRSSRRRFTALVGTAVVCGLAGCNGEGEGTDGTTAEGTGTTTGEGMTTETGATGTETEDGEETTAAETGTETEDAEGTTEAETTEEETTAEGPTTTSDPYAVVQEGNAALRVAHLSPDAPNVDVGVDGSTVLSDVAFETVSSYLVLSPGGHQVTVTPTGGETAVFDQELEVEAQAYTVAAIGEASGENQALEVVTFTDDVEPPESGTSRARLVHAAPDAPAVDVTVEGADLTLFDDVGYGTASDYAEVESGDYTVEVRPANENDDGDVVTTADVSLGDGTVVTAFATGYLAPDEAPADQPFGLTVTVDAGGE
jgi:hypothetical protein